MFNVNTVCTSIMCFGPRASQGARQIDAGWCCCRDTRRPLSRHRLALCGCCEEIQVRGQWMNQPLASVRALAQLHPRLPKIQERFEPFLFWRAPALVLMRV